MAFDNIMMSQVFPETNNIYRNGVNINPNSFTVVWKDVTYKVRHRLFRERIIINNVSGFFKSGQIMAIMGPSGCGKSSLLKCLSGNKKAGVSGSVTVSTKRKLKVAVIQQDDYLDKRLTVRESLNYASRLKNLAEIDHKSNVESVLKKLEIEKCADIRTKRCSGGQRKRVSIALELLSRPNILILDEPTSGLDSVTTWQLVNMLVDLTKHPTNPIAIIATIHQPSGRLFNLFNSVYIMSFDGQCMYQGVPQALVNFLGQYGLRCPKFHNPSDFALEVASKEHGIGRVLLLSSIMKIEALDLVAHPYRIVPYFSYNTLRDIWILTKRSFKLSYRDIWMLPLRVIAHILTIILIVLFWGSESGHLSGCPSDFIGDSGSYVENFDKVSNKLIENYGCIIFIIMFTWFGSIFAVLLTFPSEMNLVIKEYRNGWYSCFSYYMGRVIVDTFWQFIIPLIFVIPCYVWTGQYWDEDNQRWRLYYFIVICLLIALTSSSMGFVWSAWLMESPTAAAFLGVMMGFPLFLFSGFMIPVKDMPKVFQYATYGNFITFGLEAATTTVFGWDRCRKNKGTSIDLMSLITPKQMTDILASDHINVNSLMDLMSLFGGMTSEAKSVIMKRMQYEDNDF
ncbi:ATP-binding cassette sub-family G member 4-like [Oppia nitens]|uniref:ATP-binding cassette sub-family G member 4-like n=1 Tax=Oppia nitens TaxID=1686743 RepID=UPI0023DBA0B4|nr:ATP-binding cassette sub-family G member 4-like [Oppia nitens]